MDKNQGSKGLSMDEETFSLEAYLADEDTVYTATQIFDALSDYTRFQILGALCQAEHSVTELQDVSHVSQSAISHQLRLLRDRGLVQARRDGQRMLYSLDDEHVRTLIMVALHHASEAVGRG
ncbi:MAG: ArsR/SmtB family transcription factor [Atopobiaceae bacterium]